MCKCQVAFLARLVCLGIGSAESSSSSVATLGQDGRCHGLKSWTKVCQLALAWLLAEELGIPERSWAVWTPRVVESCGRRILASCFFLFSLLETSWKELSVKMDGNDVCCKPKISPRPLFLTPQKNMQTRFPPEILLRNLPWGSTNVRDPGGEDHWEYFENKDFTCLDWLVWFL